MIGAGSDCRRIGTYGRTSRKQGKEKHTLCRRTKKEDNT
jgi:hypothetical protein